MGKELFCENKEKKTKCIIHFLCDLTKGTLKVNLFLRDS